MQVSRLKLNHWFGNGWFILYIPYIHTVFIGWWPWKLCQCHQNLINSFHPSDDISTVRKFGQNTSTGSKYSTGKPYFGHFEVLVWPWKLGQGRQNLTNSSHTPNNVSRCCIMYFILCTFTFSLWLILLSKPHCACSAIHTSPLSYMLQQQLLNKLRNVRTLFKVLSSATFCD